MKSDGTVNNLVRLGIYSLAYEHEDTMDGMRYVGSDGQTHKIRKTEMTDDDIELALLAQQTANIKSIKGMLTFITGVIVVGILLGILSFLMMMN